VSSIASIEIPLGKWDNFIELMSDQALQNESQFFKMAGIYNLGLVMDALSPSDL
jgi:hypothetical protein